MVAKTATLVDNFSTDDTAKWSNRQGTVTVSGTASLACTSAFSVLATVDGAYDLTSSSIYAQIVQVPQVGSRSTFRIAAGYTSGFNDMYWFVDNSGLHAGVRVAGSADSELVIAFDSSVHKWWRLRDDGASLLWDTSPDGSAWTNQRSVSRPLLLNAVSVEFSTGSFDSTARQAFVVDNVNTLGTAAVSRTGTSSGTGTTSATARVVLTGTSSGTGTSRAMVTGATRTATGSTSGEGQTVGAIKVVLAGTSQGAGATSGVSAAYGVYIPTIGDVRAGSLVSITPVVVGVTVVSLTWTSNRAGFAFTQTNGVLTYTAPTTTQGTALAWTLTAVVRTGEAPTNNTSPLTQTTTQVITVTHSVLRHPGAWMVGVNAVLYPLALGVFFGTTVTAPPTTSYYDTATYDSASYEADDAALPNTVPLTVTATV